MSDLIINFPQETVDPSPNENFSAGYKVGTQWTNILTGVSYECVGDGRWQIESDLIAELIAAQVEELIPARHQMLLSGELEIQGVLDIQGTLDIL